MTGVASGIGRAITGATAPTLIAGNPFSDRTGRISWFGGPADHSTGSTTASGAPVSTPGIAVYDRSTLGGWWMVKMPNGVIAIAKQTDVGPAPSTGRTFDFTYSILSLLGYNQHNFPTNAGARGVYLGKDLTGAHGQTMLTLAIEKLGATTAQRTALMHAADAGSLMRGYPVAFDRNGHTASSDPSGTGTGSEAVYSPIIPDPGVTSAADAVGSFLSYLTSGPFLLMLLGGALLIVAVVEVGAEMRSKI